MHIDLIEILSKYGNYIFAIVIFFGGRWGLKFFSVFPKTQHNYLLFATLFAGLFVILEIVAGTFKPIDLATYFLTYTVVTSVYENIADIFPFLKPKNKDQ